ncbi:hypothetical protein [Geobacillus kaustophilus]|uniref:hypothetical protein n=1 Tax=Geobacillus kaustophilus TaxID=1462 RepID=UPI000B2D6E91|nr:hypothetical protein [Geobacillus kaustophilus]
MTAGRAAGGASGLVGAAEEGRINGRTARFNDLTVNVRSIFLHTSLKLYLYFENESHLHREE